MAGWLLAGWLLGWQAGKAALDPWVRREAWRLICCRQQRANRERERKKRTLRVWTRARQRDAGGTAGQGRGVSSRLCSSRARRAGEDGVGFSIGTLLSISPQASSVRSWAGRLGILRVRSAARSQPSCRTSHTPNRNAKRARLHPAHPSFSPHRLTKRRAVRSNSDCVASRPPPGGLQNLCFVFLGRPPSLAEACWVAECPSQPASSPPSVHE